jgi:hypothetical protein
MDVIESLVHGVLVLFIEDTVVKMLLLPHVKHSKLSAKQKELNFQKITPLETLVYMEGWKIFMLKGMYATKKPALIQGIWLKGSRLIYVAKKLMILVTFTETEMHIN